MTTDFSRGRRHFWAPAVAAMVSFLGCAVTRPPGTGLVAAQPGARQPAPPSFTATARGDRQNAARSPGLAALEEELKRAMSELREQDPRPYFISYEVNGHDEIHMDAREGALVASRRNRWRVLDTDVRAGDYKFDSTHPQARRGFDPSLFAVNWTALPLDDDPDALRAVAWRETQVRYRNAAQRLVELKTRSNVDVALEDTSDDFSREQPVVYLEAPAKLTFDQTAWEARVRALSARFRQAPDLLESGVSFNADNATRWLITSEGATVQTSRPAVGLFLRASTRAEDGQDLFRFESFESTTVEGLPSQAELDQAADKIIADLRQLRVAQPAEPYSGPAILEGKAAGVFFHEIFGHRVEGHRQKDDTEGQTFAKKVGQPVMPSFISVFDDPTLAKLGTTDLNGSYRVDDEGVMAQRAALIEGGVMKGFLLGRTPTRGFTRSNGHGRRQEGRRIVPRQANLVVQPSAAVSPAELRDRLRAEARRQGKEYGLLFKDISGGFTGTSRAGAQAFKVLPIMVWKVFVDGRPDQLIRGADIVGTPLTSLSKILAASDDYQVFNGHCGAESGFIPVSAVSPSLLVEQLEVERKSKGQDRPPVLPPPPTAAAGGTP